MNVKTVGRTDFVEKDLNIDTSLDAKLIIFSEGDKGYAPFLSSLAALSDDGELNLSVRIFSRTMGVSIDNDLPECVPPEWLLYHTVNSKNENILFLRITTLDERTPWLAHYETLKDIIDYVCNELNVRHLAFITSECISTTYRIDDDEIVVFNYKDNIGDNMMSSKGHLINHEFTVNGLGWMFPYLFNAFTEYEAYNVLCSGGSEPINREGMKTLFSFFESTYGLHVSDMDEASVNNIANSIEMMEMSMGDNFSDVFMNGSFFDEDEGGMTA
tara:strand:- start:1682 stop:2497 length:816 start_codon:yes stop_codon:yes gene_type:complete